jgi:predicted nucleic-acid-binding Zn-ribbon protein
MRSTQTCPKCSGQRLAVMDEFRQPEAGSSSTTVVVVVAIEAEGMFRGNAGGLGSFETWICLGCGYTEFYARRLKGIEALAEKHPDRVRIIEPTSPKRDPYR